MRQTAHNPPLGTGEDLGHGGLEARSTGQRSRGLEDRPPGTARFTSAWRDDTQFEKLGHATVEGPIMPSSSIQPIARVNFIRTEHHFRELWGE